MYPLCKDVCYKVVKQIRAVLIVARYHRGLVDDKDGVAVLVLCGHRWCIYPRHGRRIVAVYLAVYGESGVTGRVGAEHLCRATGRSKQYHLASVSLKGTHQSAG